ncbi:DUF305 domain-containing protein [Salinispora cortesiana]|uniref:DUF305 domain-containing protein n=1 Tax=Salinispora cortesiana TaxID=1305843 RepID=UPI000425C0FA|nr:DUF305 domain-containing protein [Salinispora cortesiana]
MTVRGRWVLAAVTTGALLLGVLVWSGVAYDRSRSTVPTATASSDGPGPSVIVPGRPGEPAQLRPADEVRATVTGAHNSLDTWYVRMMIPHHEQALEMSELAPGRAADPQVAALAARIRASQAPEIEVLRAWLEARNLPVEVPEHDHSTMRGMQSPEAMRRLAESRGVEFDRLFVEMMSDHHAGAVEMSIDLLKVGAEPVLLDFANSVAVEQNVEIGRMRELFGR